MARGYIAAGDVEAFVEGYVDSFATWDILALYGTSPNRLCDARHIAEAIGRPEPQVERSLRSLVEKGFFRLEGAEPQDFYHFDPEPGLARELGAFVAATSDRRGRLKALSVLLRKLGPAGPPDQLEKATGVRDVLSDGQR